MTERAIPIDLRGVKIALALPFYGPMPAQTAHCLARLTAELTQAGCVLGMVGVSNSMVQVGRNLITAQLLRGYGDFDAWLWIDADMTWRPVEVLRLIARVVPRVVEPAGVRPVDVVGAVGRVKKPDAGPIYAFRPVYNADGSWPMVEGLVPVEHVGACMMAMTPGAIRRAIRQLEIESETDSGPVRGPAWSAGAPQVWQVYPEPDGACGEDVGLCRLLARAGVQVWADPSIWLGHWGPYEWSGSVIETLAEAQVAGGRPPG